MLDATHIRCRRRVDLNCGWPYDRDADLGQCSWRAARSGGSGKLSAFQDLVHIVAGLGEGMRSIQSIGFDGFRGIAERAPGRTRPGRLYPASAIT